MTRLWRVLIPSMLLCSTLLGQQARYGLNAPLLGFILDSQSAGLRPLWGVPGAAALGGVAAADSPVVDALMSPRQDYALVLYGEERRAAAVEAGGSEFRIHPIDAAPAGIRQLTLSPNGKSAALYYEDGRRIVVVAGLPSAAAVVADHSIEAIAGVLTAFALHDDGTVLAGFAEEGAGSLFALTASGPRFVASVDHPSAISFVRRRHDAIVADRTSDNIYYLSDVAGFAQKRLLAAAENGVREPFDIALSDDDQTVFVANSKAGLTRIHLADGVVRFYPYQAESKLQRLRGNSVFLLRNAPQEPLLLFDGDADEPRFVVVPPPAERAIED